MSHVGQQEGPLIIITQGSVLKEAHLDSSFYRHYKRDTGCGESSTSSRSFHPDGTQVTVSHISLSKAILWPDTTLGSRAEGENYNICGQL